LPSISQQTLRPISLRPLAAAAVGRDGTREIPGLWIETTEGAKFWMKVFNDLRTAAWLDSLDYTSWNGRAKQVKTIQDNTDYTD
jgi:transposase-like protein